MIVGFMNEPSDIEWLKETALKGVALPFKYERFGSYILQGNEDAPYAVNLYASIDPNHDDNYYRVCFDVVEPEYCVAVEYDGKIDAPISGFSKIGG